MLISGAHMTPFEMHRMEWNDRWHFLVWTVNSFNHILKVVQNYSVADFAFMNSIDFWNDLWRNENASNPPKNLYTHTYFGAFMRYNLENAFHFLSCTHLRWKRQRNRTMSKKKSKNAYSSLNNVICLIHFDGK